MLFGILDVCLLGNLLIDKDTIWANKGTIRTRQDFQFHLIL